MSTISEITNELERIDTHFSRIILDKNWSVTDLTVSWPNYVSGIRDKRGYREYFDFLINAKQQSYRLVDGGVVQLFYEFENRDTLIRSRCCYSPQYSTELIVPDSELDISPSDDEDRITTFFRIDFDRAVSTHSKSHFQFGGLNELRIPLDSAVHPYLFMDLIAQALFPNDYTEISRKAHYAPSVDNCLRVQIATAIDARHRIKCICS